MALHKHKNNLEKANPSGVDTVSLPEDLDFGEFFTPTKRNSTPMKELEHPAIMSEGATKSMNIIAPEKMLAKGPVKKDKLDGTSESFTPTEVHFDIDMDKMTGS